MHTIDDAGILNRTDARLWRNWWIARGHQAIIEPTGRRKLYRCYLRLCR